MLGQTKVGFQPDKKELDALSWWTDALIVLVVIGL